ncbi:MAG: sodium ion-translocating decarboxylase subunit beta [Dehalococcoidia bacterium]|nr:sodium ion-translocating decarboxylase subunit beta [Dehalococcoidia bacterium]MQG00239.1 sodium ion-translocating decarboxylase subunit beta [SAR202 cluster bacterium]|tara:strand:+ start:2605 stop:3711 length:1107 start_codon:yes stop_codon:yes gene_type:complete
MSIELLGAIPDLTIPHVVMIIISLGMIYLGIVKGYEPLLLLPIGVGVLMANLPSTGIIEDDGLLGMLRRIGLDTELFPLLMFLGVGALTDFTPMLQNPITVLLGAAAQFGIFAALVAALILGWDLETAGAIGIIGSADGPTTIFVATQLADIDLWGPIAVAAYSYMAMVPIIQPPIMRLLTTKKERQIRMPYPNTTASKKAKIIFPIVVIILASLIAPESAPLVGMLMFGNLLREAGVVDRLSQSAQNEIINITTIFLGLAVGSTMTASRFLDQQTIGIFLLGLFAFAVATSTGVIFGKIMCYFSGGKINPLIGAAGVSAIPMAARVVQRVGQEEDPENWLLMHAMGPNVAGVLGSAIAGGVILGILS